jgi:hypothetical protein
MGPRPLLEMYSWKLNVPRGVLGSERYPGAVKVDGWEMRRITYPKS